MFKRFQGMFENIQGNINKNFREYSKRFRGMFESTTGDVIEESGECSRGFHGIIYFMTSGFLFIDQ